MWCFQKKRRGIESWPESLGREDSFEVYTWSILHKFSCTFFSPHRWSKSICKQTIFFHVTHLGYSQLFKVWGFLPKVSHQQYSTNCREKETGQKVGVWKYSCYHERKNKTIKAIDCKIMNDLLAFAFSCSWSMFTWLGVYFKKNKTWWLQWIDFAGQLSQMEHYKHIKS